MELIDSHCHIHDTQFFAPDEQLVVYQRAREAGVAMLCIGTDQADSRAAVQFAGAHEGVWAVVGVHPHDTKDGVDDIGVLLKEYFVNEAAAGNDASRRLQGKGRISGLTPGMQAEGLAPPERIVVGVGEIGLDYYYNHSPRDVQITALEQQLQWAVDYDLPVSFHVRDASSPQGRESVWSDFWPVYDNFTGVRGVLHSFSDTQSNVDRAFERNLLIGVNGISTFTKVPEQQQMYASLPLDKIVLETDAPFLTPKPFRGKINEPMFVGRVAEHLAVLYNVPYLEVTATTTENAKRLFDIN